jgi:hypothetical protein
MRKYRFAVVAVICVVAVILIYDFVLPVSIPDNVAGTLHPENIPTPVNDCVEIAPKDAFFVFVGPKVASFDSGQSQYVLVAGKSAPALTVEFNKNDLIIKGSVYDIKGLRVAIIESGSFKRIDENNSSVLRSGDSSTLIVKDGDGNELFFLRYLNPHAVEIRGVFPRKEWPGTHHPGSSYLPGVQSERWSCFYSKYNRYAAFSNCYANSITGCQ